MQTNTLTLVTQLLSAIAWPITTLTCVLLVRPLLLRLVPLIRTVKYSDVEISFGQEVAELKAAAASIQRMDVEAKEQPIWEDLIRLASVRPRTAIAKAWLQVEATVIKVAKKHHMQVASVVWQMPMVLGSLLLNEQKMSIDQYKLLSRLRQLANEASHAPVDTLKPDDAVEFVGLGLRLAASLDSEGSPE
jgi:hypothetical protein